MADVIIIFIILLLPLLSAASPPPPITAPSSPKPSPTSNQTIAPQIKPSPPPSPPQQPPPPLVQPPPHQPQESQEVQSPPQQPPPPLVQPPPYQPQEVQSPPPPRTEDRQERMKNILEALIGSGDFGNWGNLLTTADPSLLPFTSTLFVPNNDVVLSSFPSDNGVNAVVDPFLFLYHIVPHRLSFNDLCLFNAPNTRLPTLLPTKSILITNASRANFTIDGARVTDPDLYSTDSVVIHGIGGLLDYQVFGGDGSVASLPWMNQSQSQNQGVGVVPKLVESSKGGILRYGFTAFAGLGFGLLMI